MSIGLYAIKLSGASFEGTQLNAHIIHNNPRSNLCTGAIIRDTGSGIVDGQYQLKYDTQGEQGTPCYGDRGTSLMFKEKERYS